MTRFKTNKRLWFWLTIALWVPCWFIPIQGKGDERWNPLLMIWESFRAIFEWGFSLDKIEEFVVILFMFVATTGFAAAAIAWVIHCPIVMVRTKLKRAA
jgi:hypothetical protein